MMVGSDVFPIETESSFLGDMLGFWGVVGHVFIIFTPT